jgi:hypothetical protein
MLSRLSSYSLPPLPRQSPRHIQSSRSRKLVICKSYDITSIESLELTSYLISKSIITFTMIYTGLNYLHYKFLNDKDKE